MIFRETISEELAAVIQKVFDEPSFNNFRLCGGTALALQFGHRISVDADFVAEKDFNREVIIKIANEVFQNTSDIQNGTHGVFLRADSIKVDFLTWNIPFIREQIAFKNWRLCSLEEIAAMKLFAITQRGEKKDYFDIAALLSKYSLVQLFDFYKERHPQNDVSVVARFLVSYSDFDNSPDPIMLNNMKWEDCKTILQKSVGEYLNQ